MLSENLIQESHGAKTFLIAQLAGEGIMLKRINSTIHKCAPRRSSVANAGGRAFCQELGMGWVHIGQWIFSISAISH